MTANEHKLIKTMLGMQLAMMGELINVLRENGTLKTGDQAQMWNIALQEAGKREIFSAISDMYARVAATCGVNIDSQN
jgi:hypothetical protein